MDARYDGKPILLLMESYALAVIGELAPEKEATARDVVAKVFGDGESWRATFRKTMGWPDTIDAEILVNWATFTRLAREQSMTSDPAVFARHFADAFA